MPVTQRDHAYAADEEVETEKVMCPYHSAEHVCKWPERPIPGYTGPETEGRKLRGLFTASSY